MADNENNQPESIWKKLTRLFRSGPVIRHKIAAGERRQEPQGTARAYKKEVSSLYVNSLSSYGQYERLARYGDYQEMELTPEICSALNITADETCCEDEYGNIIKITSDNDEMKQDLEELFYNIINVDFNLWSWVRNLLKYGDTCLFVDASTENGILNLLPIPINEIEREEGYDKEDPFAVRYRWLTQGNTILQNWQIIHFRMLGNDAFLPYGQSMIEPARRIWRQLILIEDAMLVYRIVRSPERRMFKIPVGNIAPEEVDRFMEDIKNKMKRQTIVDPSTGRVDMRYSAMDMIDDYYLPTRGGEGPTIESLPGGAFTGDIEDVQYIQGKLFAALQVPKAYLGYEQDIGSKSTLAQQDVRFAKTIERIQKMVIAELNKIALVHLYLLGYRGAELTKFNIEMASPSTIAQQQHLELWRMKLEVAGAAQEGMLSKEMIYRDIFGFDDNQIARLNEGRKLDKLMDLEIDAMTLPEAGGATEPATTPAAEAETAAEEVPGEEQLPATLGGSPGGEGAPEAGTTPESVEASPILERNPGSEGGDAIIAVDKGRDMFSTGEDAKELVFGTKKQTASDPFDRRAMKRLITRPFSENIDYTDLKVREIEKITEDVQRGLGRIFGRKNSRRTRQ